MAGGAGGRRWRTRRRTTTVVGGRWPWRRAVGSAACDQHQAHSAAHRTAPLGRGAPCGAPCRIYIRCGSLGTFFPDNAEVALEEYAYSSREILTGGLTMAAAAANSHAWTTNDGQRNRAVRVGRHPRHMDAAFAIAPTRPRKPLSLPHLHMAAYESARCQGSGWHRAFSWPVRGSDSDRAAQRLRSGVSRRYKLTREGRGPGVAPREWWHSAVRQAVPKAPCSLRDLLPQRSR